ncbi:hypothetical protein FK513_28190, partial [Klebsiella pneumoniae]|nr:hypothetical protein [Klebsiella pneumoniae]
DRRAVLRLRHDPAGAAHCARIGAFRQPAPARLDFICSSLPASRKGFRSGQGEALAVVFPGTLLELWRVLNACVDADKIILMQAANTDADRDGKNIS